jgi:hypothetical protein
MANTFSSALVVDTATKEAITVLQDKLAALKSFNTDFSDDVVDPLRKLQAGVVTAAGPAVLNPTNFAGGSNTMKNAPVVMTHISQPFNLTSLQLNQGFRLEKLMKINLASFCNQIMDVALAPVGALLGASSTPTFGVGYTSAVTKATGGQIGNSFISDGIGTLWASIAKGTEKHLVLDGSYYQFLLPQTGMSLDMSNKGAYGFDGIHLNTRWNSILAAGVDATGVSALVASAGTDTGLNGSSGGKTIKGFAASPEAMACASAIPYLDPAVSQNYLISETIETPLGISVQLNIWGDMNARSLNASFDVAFGSAVADTSALTTLAV